MFVSGRKADVFEREEIPPFALIPFGEVFDFNMRHWADSPNRGNWPDSLDELGVKALEIYHSINGAGPDHELVPWL